MCDDPLAAILSPDGAVLADPSQVERALAALWKAPPDEPDAEVATRVCAANLIVVGQPSNWNDLSEALGVLSPDVPSRTIVLLVERTPAHPPTVRASVSALCHVPQPHRPQVCCEQIVLRTGQASDLPRTLLPLLVGDVPTMVWWTLDPITPAALLPAIRDMADRLILDAGLAGLAYLESTARCAVRELGWYRTQPWRELLAGLFDGADRAALEAIEQVVITMAGRSPVDRIDAVWLAAFLAGQLGWRPSERLAGDRFILAGQRRHPEVLLGVEADDRPGLAALAIRAGQSHYEITRCPGSAGQYRLIECDQNVCEMPRCVDAARARRPDALAMALLGRASDGAFVRAAPVAQWMTQGNP